MRFADNFRRHGEVGAAVAIAVDGVLVVDMWAGWMDAARTRAWQRDTLVDVFSVGKAMAALCVLILVERGEGGPGGARGALLAASSRRRARAR